MRFLEKCFTYALPKFQKTKPDFLKSPVSGVAGAGLFALLVILLEVLNQMISDLLEFVEVAEELINANVIKTPEIISN